MCPYLVPLPKARSASLRPAPPLPSWAQLSQARGPVLAETGRSEYSACTQDLVHLLEGLRLAPGEPAAFRPRFQVCPSTELRPWKYPSPPHECRAARRVPFADYRRTVPARFCPKMPPPFLPCIP